MSTTERQNRELSEKLFEVAIEYKEGWELEMERRRRTGNTGPMPLPHPDDIQVNVRTGEVEFTGPMTKEEKQRRDRIIEIKDTCRDEIETLEEELSRDSLCPEIRAEFEGYVENHRRILAKAREILPDDQEAAYRARYEGKAEAQGNNS